MRQGEGMSPLRRLRIELPDLPGALAHVASTLGDRGANVVSVDIHELEAGTAVDEILVDAPDDWDPRAVDHDLRRTGGTLLSWAVVTDVRDPMVTALSWAGALLAAARSDEADDELGRAILEVTAGTAAWVCSVREAVAYEAGRLALERGGPVVRRTDDLPETGAGPTSVWLLAVPDGHLDTTVVAFAARPLTLRFTASEINRVEALLALRRQIVARHVAV
jgi:hypothetical protein